MQLFICLSVFCNRSQVLVCSIRSIYCIIGCLIYGYTLSLPQAYIHTYYLYRIFHCTRLALQSWSSNERRTNLYNVSTDLLKTTIISNNNKETVSSVASSTNLSFYLPFRSQVIQIKYVDACIPHIDKGAQKTRTLLLKRKKEINHTSTKQCAMRISISIYIYAL